MNLLKKIKSLILYLIENKFPSWEFKSPVIDPLWEAKYFSPNDYLSLDDKISLKTIKSGLSEKYFKLKHEIDNLILERDEKKSELEKMKVQAVINKKSQDMTCLKVCCDTSNYMDLEFFYNNGCYRTSKEISEYVDFKEKLYDSFYQYKWNQSVTRNLFLYLSTISIIVLDALICLAFYPVITYLFIASLIITFKLGFIFVILCAITFFVIPKLVNAAFFPEHRPKYTDVTQEYINNILRKSVNYGIGLKLLSNIY